ncbi:type II toxin-antitoxin system PemK/MazF family toxin [Leptospira santarosai]|uniref:type II toxin-antitoxin system PemK/MazF family toxin n=1 Tax=Leptospira santarosai TaxID=28183 RepID=UPI000772D873|nr:type II toxin-antitoxin system PemK/MazF family toxin [Leptospira santarosai]MDI7230466.1 type II toxin-antitoxin system PemK/MazF family toxin [Leptospira santarosai]
MQSTTIFDFGDIVLVNFPFTNLQSFKKRPAVIISNQAYQQQRQDIILMAVTSQIREPLDFGEALIKDWQVAGLAKPSVFKPLIATIEQALIVKSLGHLSTKDKNSLQALIRSILVSESEP